MDCRHLVPTQPKYVLGKCDSFNSFSTEKSSNGCRCVSVSPVDSMFSSATSMSPPPATDVKKGSSNYVDYNHQMEVEKLAVCSLFVKDSTNKTCKQPKCISQHSFQSFAKYMDNKKIEDSADFAEIFDLAAAFNIPDLKQTCIEIILKNIAQYSALDIFNLGHFHKCQELTEAAFVVIQKTFPDLGNEYIRAPNAVNMLVTSIHKIIDFMP